MPSSRPTSNTKKKLKLSLNHNASLSRRSTPTATKEHSSSKECTSSFPAEVPVTDTQVSNGSCSIPNSPLSSREKLPPPPKTSSSANDLRAVPSSCTKRSFASTQSSSGKPQKVAWSSADHASSAKKKPQPYTRPDPSSATSAMHNNDPQANPSGKSGSTCQPSPSTGPPDPASPANDLHAVPSSCKKRSFTGTLTSYGKPQKVPSSSADHASGAKTPKPNMSPDPTSPTQNNDQQANPSEKSVSTGQPSPSTGPTVPASTQPISPIEIANDSADSFPIPNCDSLIRFQCKHCAIKLNSRNCFSL